VILSDEDNLMKVTSGE